MDQVSPKFEPRRDIFISKHSSY